MNEKNKMELKFRALSENESFARATVAGFCLSLNPTIDEITDIKTAVSEAVTNSVVHAYPNKKDGNITITVTLYESMLKIEVVDNGVGIKDIERARQPFYTTRPDDERSGMGFTVMESFMDSMELENLETGGLKVTLTKTIKENKEKLKKLG